jgi:hypothetical protein
MQKAAEESAAFLGGLAQSQMGVKPIASAKCETAVN